MQEAEAGHVESECIDGNVRDYFVPHTLQSQSADVSVRTSGVRLFHCDPAVAAEFAARCCRGARQGARLLPCEVGIGSSGKARLTCSRGLQGRKSSGEISGFERWA